MMLGAAGKIESLIAILSLLHRAATPPNLSLSLESIEADL